MMLFHVGLIRVKIYSIRIMKKNEYRIKMCVCVCVCVC